VTDPLELRAATFNVRNGRAPDRCRAWPFRRRAFARTVAALGADVLGFQEAYRFQLDWLLKRLPRHRSVGVGRRDGADGGEHCAVLYDQVRFTLEHERTRWFADDPDHAGASLPRANHPRIATLVRLRDAQTGRAFGVANTHFDERRQDNRERSADLLLSWLEPDVRWLVMGDFNAEPSNPLFERFGAAGYRPVLASGPPGSAHQFTGRTDGPLIDNILVGPEWEVRSAAVVTDTPGRQLPSDHWPVVADLTLRSPATQAGHSGARSGNSPRRT